MQSLSNKRKAKFLKLDALTRAVTEVLYTADPVGLAKMTKRPDEFSTEATQIVKLVRTAPGLTSHRVAQICWKVFADFFDEKEANAFKQWNQVGEVIFWLFENEGKWILS